MIWSILPYALPSLSAVMAWWGATALVFYLNNLPRQTFLWSMLVATILAAISLHGLATTKMLTTTASAYLAFASALVAWTWMQMSFFMGFITGPRLVPPTEGVTGWRHFKQGVLVSLYHDLACLALVLSTIAITWHAPNRVGQWTILLLWGMHLSAKLNLFLGVRNLNAEFLPPHMDFIRPFLTQRPMNLLFPLSVSVPIIIAVLLVQRVVAAEADPLQVTGGMLLLSLLVLAILEHWVLVLPLPAARSWNALWLWTISSRDRRLSASHRALLPKTSPWHSEAQRMPSANWRSK